MCEEWKSLGNDNYINDSYGNCDNYSPTVEHSLLPLASDLDSTYMRGYENGKVEGILKASTRPKGEWVVKRLQNGFEDVYCPYCNARPTRSEYGYYRKDKFCHECGADMRKGGNNETDN